MTITYWASAGTESRISIAKVRENLTIRASAPAKYATTGIILRSLDKIPERPRIHATVP
jgi:hypothetical protein